MLATGGALLVRPFLVAAHLSAGSAALEAARSSVEPAADLERALQSLARAQDLDPQNPLIFRRIAEVAMLQRRPDAAVEALEIARSLAPTSLLIRRELMYAYLEAGRPADAAIVLDTLTDGSADVLAVADIEIRAGNLERALAAYNNLIAGAETPEPYLFLRAALTAAALGDGAEAARLLRALDAPEAVITAIASPAVSRAPYDLFAPPDLLVQSQEGHPGASSLMVLFGGGWYPYEPDAWRWASSPAQLIAYSTQPRQAELTLDVAFVHDPTAPTGLGPSGVLDVELQTGQHTQLVVTAGAPAVLRTELPAGWSVITMNLVAGNYRPAATVEGSGDTRTLSFATRSVRLVYSGH